MFRFVSWLGRTLPLLYAADWFRLISLLKTSLDFSTLSLHDALPIFDRRVQGRGRGQRPPLRPDAGRRSGEHMSELQSRENLVWRILLSKKKSLLTSFPV